MTPLDTKIESTPFGLLKLIGGGCPVSQALRCGENWDWHVYDALAPYLDGRVLDIGANVGALTRRFATLAKSVWAFEPHPDLVECLEFNTRGMQGVRIFAYGLYSSEVMMSPYERPGTSPSAWIWGTGEGTELTMKPLPPCEERVSAIKVDAQGADLHCLIGCEPVIERDHPAIVFEFEKDGAIVHGHTWENYLEQLERWGYSAPVKIHENAQDFLTIWRG